MSRAASTPLVSPRLVWGLVGLSFVLAAVFIPTRRQVQQRLIRDGEVARAAELSTQPLPRPEQNKAPATPLEQLRHAVETDHDVDALLAIRMANDPKACLDVLHEAAHGMSAEHRAQLYDACATGALGQGDVALSAQIYTEILAFHPTEAMLRRTVEVSRWAGQPALALTALEKWKKTTPLPAGLEDQQIALYREVNRPGRALELVKARLAAKQQAGQTLTGAEIHLAMEIADNAGRAKDLLPLVEHHLSTIPAATASLEDLKSGKVKADEEFISFTRLLAQQSEWNGEPGRAVDYYTKLVMLGDAAALERVEKLLPGLNRRGDWMTLLEMLIPVPGRPELQLELAKLQGISGLYDKAQASYEAWLKDHPKDAVAWFELGAVHDERGEMKESLAAYQQAAACAPENLDYRREVADTQVALGDFRGAFAFFHSLPEKKHDAVTLETYALLAESLADYEAANRALLIRYHRLRNPKADDILELVRSFSIIGKPEGAITVLEEGRRRLPGSRILRMELAQAYRNAERYDEALRLLATEELKRDMRAMCLFIEVACLKEDYQFALSFLGRGFENRFAFPPDARLDLGHIYFNNGYMTEASRLYSSVPDEPSLWPLLASARFKIGEFAAAENYQRRYLNHNKVPDPAGWLLLGDILKAQGRQDDANAAYAQSLRLMTGKIANADSAGTDEELADTRRERPRPTRNTSR